MFIQLEYANISHARILITSSSVTFLTDALFPEKILVHFSFPDFKQSEKVRMSCKVLVACDPTNYVCILISNFRIFFLSKNMQKLLCMLSSRRKILIAISFCILTLDTKRHVYVCVHDYCAVAYACRSIYHFFFSSCSFHDETEWRRFYNTIRYFNNFTR